MTTTNYTVLRVMNILFWLAFIALCIKTGAMLTAFLVSLFISAEGAKDLYLGLNLYELYLFNKTYYIGIISMLISVSGLKAYMAYFVVRVFMNFKLSNPFNSKLTALLLKISHIGLGTGVLAIIADSYSAWIAKKGVAIPIDWSGDDILFFAGVIYLLALVFKKGADLQSENDLTV